MKNYFLTYNFIKKKFLQIAYANIIRSIRLIKISLKLKKNKIVSFTHFNLDFTFQHYLGNVICKKNNFYKIGVISIRVRNSRYGFEICYLPSNPFVRQRIL